MLWPPLDRFLDMAVPGELVLSDHEGGPADVALAVVDELDDRAMCAIRALHRQGNTRVVVVAGHLDDRRLVDAIESLMPLPLKG